jgi:transposase
VLSLQQKSDMLKIEIPESEKQLLREERYTHPHPRVMRKTDALYLKSFGLKNDLICDIIGVCDNTLREYFKQYSEGGMERLKEVNFYRPGSDLKEFSGAIEDYFSKNPPASISQAAAVIEEITGIKRGETQVRKFMKSLNFKFMKCGYVPSKVLDESKKKNSGNFWKKNSNLD